MTHPIYREHNSITCPQCGVETHISRGGEVKNCASCSLPLQRIAGKYRLREMIGKGGQGVVYLAEHVHLPLNPLRAIKFLSSDIICNDNVRRRFYQEIQITAGISQTNDHIVRVYDDFGEHPDLGAFYVMEYLQGQSLAAFIHGGVGGEVQEDRTLKTILHIFYQICLALDTAHRAGVLHRDLKPENIFLAKRPRDPYFVKVVDFGVAKLSASKRLTLSSQGLIGTPTHICPEQIMGSPQDARSDIYSMGSLLYEMLVGHPPFLHPSEEGKNVMQVIEDQLTATPVPPSQLREQKLPDELESLVLQCLEKKPEHRPQSVQAMLNTLELLKDQPELIAAQNAASPFFSMPTPPTEAEAPPPLTLHPLQDAPGIASWERPAEADQPHYTRSVLPLLSSGFGAATLALLGGLFLLVGGVLLGVSGFEKAPLSQEPQVSQKAQNTRPSRLTANIAPRPGSLSLGERGEKEPKQPLSAAKDKLPDLPPPGAIDQLPLHLRPAKQAIQEPKKLPVREPRQDRRRLPLSQKAR